MGSLIVADAFALMFPTCFTVQLGPNPLPASLLILLAFPLHYKAPSPPFTSLQLASSRGHSFPVLQVPFVH